MQFEGIIINVSGNDFHFWSGWWIESHFVRLLPPLPHHFFLQNLIWREATIVWNGHQSKKLKNRFRLRLDHSVLNTVGANQMELIEWKVSLGIRSIIPSVQDITLGRSRIDKQMQISLFFCYDTKTYIGYSAGTSACIDNTDRSRFFPFLDNFRCFGFCQFGGPDFSKFRILDKFWITQIPRLRRQCFWILKYCRRRENSGLGRMDVFW